MTRAVIPELWTFVSGVLIAGYWVAALFFLRFWRTSRDRLFAMFAAAFFLLGVQRVVLAGVVALAGADRTMLWPYVVRLIAFVVILAAIVDKNRSA